MSKLDMESPGKDFGVVPSTARSVPQRFPVIFPEAELDDLQTLIGASRVGPVTFEGLQQDRKYGIATQWLYDAKQAWLKHFNWKEVEEKINAFPSFKLPVEHKGDTYDMHFLALFSSNPSAAPVMMLHGWPGSFLEFMPILRLLSTKYTPENLPYHVIVPSLPGYTMSSPPPKDKDFRIEDAATILDTLMKQLGFEHSGYVVQAGDVGSKLARVLGGTTDNAAKAIHLNFCIMPDPINVTVTAYSELDRAGIERAAWFKSIGSAYALEHATRPSTIGLTLSSSPLALLAWIGEKFLEWTDEDPDLHSILEDVTLYWLTNCASTCLWPYRQLFTPGNIGAHENPEWHIHKPLGFSWFPKEIAPVPKAWIETTGNLVWFRQHDRGGHFAALEKPDVLLDDLEEFVAQVWPGVRQSV